ncbi:MAG: hypothetical protein Q4G62_10805 [Pseudomonadota bacterium]|nr:hypothetical protein [Pseudomonadota bacterium]
MSRFFPEWSPALKRYYRRSLLPGAVYIAMVAASKMVLPMLPDSMLLKITVALLPLLALTWLIAEHVRFLRTCDELERRIETNSLLACTALSLLVGMGLLFVLGTHLVVLEAKHVAMTMALLPIIAYVFSRHFLHRHYR